jgi:hypothetical protein
MLKYERLNNDVCEGNAIRHYEYPKTYKNLVSKKLSTAANDVTVSLQGNIEERGGNIYMHPSFTPSVCTSDSFHPGPSIDLALLYSKGRILPQDVKL